MLPKKDRVAIYECLFIKGVMVARKNYEIPKHLELECIPNLEVIKSLKSKGYVKEQSAWRHFYWYLTNEGVKYLRGYLHVPPEIVPLTLKGQARLKATQARLEATRPRPATGARSETSRPMEDRAGYRRGPGGKPQ